MAAHDARAASALAVTLRRWAVEDMGLIPEHTAPPESTLESICRGSARPIFEFLTTHIRPTKTVDMVRQNLKLYPEVLAAPTRAKPAGSGGEREVGRRLQRLRQLQARRQACARRRAELAAATSILEQDLQSITAQLASSGVAVQQETRRLAEEQQRDLLSKGFVRATTRDIDVLNELAHRLDAHSKPRRQLSKRPSSQPQQKDTPLASDARLETSCQASVRERCTALEDLFHELLSETSPLVSTEEDDRQRLWEGVQGLWQSHPPAEIAEALVRLARLTARRVAEITKAIDVARDAKELRFELQAGGHLADQTALDDPFHTVQQLLRALQQEHVQAFVETSEAQVQLASRRQELRSLQAQVQPTAADTRRMQVAALRSAVQAARSHCQQLEQLIDRRCRYAEELAAMHARIQHFAARTEHKQQLIQQLIRDNQQGPARLDASAQKVRDYAASVLAPSLAEIQEAAAQLAGSVVHEHSLFREFPLQHALLSTLDTSPRTPVTSLSIRRFDNPRQLAELSGITTAPAAPLYKGPEALLAGYLDLKRAADFAEARARDVRQGREDASHLYPADWPERVGELSRRCEKLARVQLEDYVPMLESCIHAADAALRECNTGHDLIDEWTMQPAQYLVPFVTQGGKNVQAWHDDFQQLKRELQALHAQ